MRKLAVWMIAVPMLTALPALAKGTVYVPAFNTSVDGTMLKTRVRVTNPTAAAHSFTTVFIANGDDGTLPDRDATPIAVGANETRILVGVAPAGSDGLLEINSDDELVFESVLQSYDATGALLSSTIVPAVSSANLIPGGTPVHLLGMQRTAEGTHTHFGVVNLVPEPNQCRVQVFDSSGKALMSPAIVPVRPLSRLQFDDALDIIGQASLAEAHADVECDQDSFPYLITVGTDPARLLFIGPATTGESTLTPGGQIDTIQYASPGNFLTATTSSSYAFVDLPVEGGVTYSRITIDFDFYLDHFPSGLFHTLTSLRSNGLFYVVTLRGSNNKTFLDLPNRQGQDGTGPWQKGHTYHIRLDFDTTTNLATFDVFEGGQALFHLQGPAGRTDLGAIGSPLRLDFSQAKVYDEGAYFPFWGSVFSNLKVVIYPKA